MTCPHCKGTGYEPGQSKKPNPRKCRKCSWALSVDKAIRMEIINSARPKISNQPIGTQAAGEPLGRNWKT